MQEESRSTGDRLRVLMDEQGWTLVRLADASGVSKNTIWELGHREDRRPQKRTMQRLADVLGVDVAYLLGTSDDRRAFGDTAEPGDLTALRKEAASVWRAVDDMLAASGGRLRAFRSGHDWPCFGIPASSTMIVDTEAEPKSGDLVLVRDESGAPAIRYLVEPYLIGCQPSGQIFHETGRARGDIMGRIIVSMLPQ